MVRFSRPVVLQSGASPVTASGQSNGFDVSQFTEGLLLVNVTAASGTSPTLTLYVDTLDPVTNTWFTHPATSSGVSANTVNKYVIQLTNFGQQIRLRWSVGGTSPSYTFTAVFVAKS